MSKRFSSGSLGLCFSVTVLLLAGCGGGGGGSGGGASLSIGSTKAELGRKIFFDESLSSQGNQSCASCHDPDHGFADGRVSETAPVSEGSEAGAFGDRNAPTAAYASFIPEFGLVTTQQTDSDTDSKYQGGQFLDGRRSTLIEQAKDPFLNSVEMNNFDELDVVTKVSNASYANDFKTHYGADSFDGNRTGETYHNIADAIAAFEMSAELRPFTSKYDAYLRGDYNFTDAEQRGLDLFIGSNSVNKDAKCNNCHTLDETVGSASEDSLFTSFEYYNVGTPKNPDNPVYVLTPAFIDLGLGGVVNETTENGKFRVPTLRNVALTAPYMHNGVYLTLREVIEHYDIFAGAGPTGLTAGPPEVGSTDRSVDDPLIANELEDTLNMAGLGLDSAPATAPAFNDYDALEAFMLTLSDGYL